MFFVYLLAAVVVLALIARAEGDESIGFGATLELNDAVGDTYAAIPKIETLGFPNEKTGNVESKTLDLADAVIQKLPTLKDGGSFTVKIHLIAATMTRLEAVRVARAVKRWKFTVPTDTGTFVKIVPGFIESNTLEDLEAEKITVINCTVIVSGASIAP